MARQEPPAEDGVDVRAHWDANAEQWAAYVRRGWDAYREVFNNPAFFAFLGDVDGLDVLDAGCGEGHNTRLLARRGARVTGVDISPRMIGLARAAEHHAPLGIRYEVAAFEDLAPIPTAAFDLVVAFMALMDGADLAGGLRELYRVLRPGGRFVFSLTHPCFITPGAGWLRDEDGDEVALRVADYFATRPYVEQWTFSKAPVPPDDPPFSVPRFPRTLSVYLNSLIDAGFVLSRFEEPRPSPEAASAHPWLRRWRRHAALFLYIEAAKPLTPEKAS